MTIEQTVEIPENHRLFFDIPRYIPSGKAKVALTVDPEQPSIQTGTAVSRHFGRLKNSKAFAGDPVAIQRQMRAEWDD